MNQPHQLPLYLPARPTAEIIEDRLALAVTEFNEPAVTPERRLELHSEIVRLRALLSGKERAT